MADQVTGWLVAAALWALGFSASWLASRDETHTLYRVCLCALWPAMCATLVAIEARRSAVVWFRMVRLWGRMR